MDKSSAVKYSTAEAKFSSISAAETYLCTCANLPLCMHIQNAYSLHKTLIASDNFNIIH